MIGSRIDKKLHAAMASCGTKQVLSYEISGNKRLYITLEIRSFSLKLPKKLAMIR